MEQVIITMKKILCFLLGFMFVMMINRVEAAQTWQPIYDKIAKEISVVYSTYASGDPEGAKTVVNNIYYGIYEKDGLESAVRTGISAKSANLTEYQFYKLKKSIRSNASQAEVESEGAKLLEMIQLEVNTLDKSGIASGSWAMFLQAFIILLREGLEAILVLIGIITYLKRAGHTKIISSVYNWAIFAIILSFISAYIFNSVFEATATGASRELLEGFTALFAVVVLLGTSAWMGGKANASAWKNYITGMVKMTISTGKARALGLAVFLAVYREGAEVILFYQALFNNAVGNVDMIWVGFLAGCAMLAIIFICMQKGALKIPVTSFFKFTSLFMFILAVTFAGGGLKELQEADVITTTVIENIPIPNIDLLGLYPTYETILPQLLLIITAVGIVIYKRSAANAAI